MFSKRILYFPLALLASLFVLEGVFRIFIPQNIVPFTTTSAFDISRILKKDLNVTLRHWDNFSYRVVTNSKHLRSSKEIPYEKKEGVFRILCLGDSILFGYGVDNHETFSFYLEEVLNKYSKNVRYEVINAAVPGWGPVEYLLFLKNEGYKYNPDLVITTNFTDDFDELPAWRIAFKNIYYEKKEDYEKLLLDGFYIKPLSLDSDNVVFDKIFQSGIYKKLSPSSHFLRYFRNKIKKGLVKRHHDQNSLFLYQWLANNKLENRSKIEWFLPQRNFTSDLIYKKLYQWGKTEDKKSLWTKTGYFLKFFSVLDELSNWFNSKKVNWLVLSLPIFQEVLEMKNESRLDFKVNTKYFDSLNLTESLIGYSKKTSELIFFPGDNHWTPAGHYLVALIVGHYLAEKGLVKASIPMSMNKPFFKEIEIKLAQANQKISAKLRAQDQWAFMQAIHYKNVGNKQLALELFKKHIERFPEDKETYFQMGMLYSDLSDYDKSIEYIKLSADSNYENDQRVLIKLGEIYLLQKDSDNALETLLKAEKLGGSFTPEIQSRIGQLFLTKKQFQKAEPYFKLAIGARPKDPGYLINYGNFFMTTGRFKEAVMQFKLALKLAPKWTLALEALGGAYWKLGEKNLAIDSLRKILQLDPNNKMAIATLKFFEESSKKAKNTSLK